MDKRRQRLLFITCSFLLVTLESIAPGGNGVYATETSEAINVSRAIELQSGDPVFNHTEGVLEDTSSAENTEYVNDTQDMEKITSEEPQEDEIGSNNEEETTVFKKQWHEEETKKRILDPYDYTDTGETTNAGDGQIGAESTWGTEINNEEDSQSENEDGKEEEDYVMNSIQAKEYVEYSYNSYNEYEMDQYFDVDDKTTHVDFGKMDFTNIEFSKYKSNVVLKKDKRSQLQKAMERVFNFTHYILNFTRTNDTHLPEGYMFVHEGAISLGPKVHMNEWFKLLGMNWFYNMWVFFLLILMVVMPFIAVLYWCFCCCHRVPHTCPPCTDHRDDIKRLIYGILLLLLVILLILGVVVTCVANKLINQGFKTVRTTLIESRKEACSYLKEVSDYIDHLFINNYDELFSHLTPMLLTVNLQIFDNLKNGSGIDPFNELSRIFSNMNAAKFEMENLNKNHKELIFLTAQLRDGLRGVKRDVNFACTQDFLPRCIDFLKFSSIQFIDTAPCLHIDDLPKTKKYLKHINQILADKHSDIVQKIFIRSMIIKGIITHEINTMVQGIIENLRLARLAMRHNAFIVRKNVETVVAKLHTNTLELSRSFESIHSSFPSDRAQVSIIVCILLLLLVIILVIALICGFCGSKSAGGNLLCFAIFIMFSVFSFIILVSLFYFILGVLTFHVGCLVTPNHNDASKHHRLYYENEAFLDAPLLEYMYESLIPGGLVELGNAMNNCDDNHTIFGVLLNVSKISNLKILDMEEHKQLNSSIDLSKFTLIDIEERQLLMAVARGMLSSYHSDGYFEKMCSTLTPKPLTELAEEIRETAKNIYHPLKNISDVKVTLLNNAVNLETYNELLVNKILEIQMSIKRNALNIDDLLLFKNMNFLKSVKTIIKYIMQAEEFIQSSTDELVDNIMMDMINFCEQQVNSYIQMITDECINNVGKCKPFAKIFYRSVDNICSRFVDPINAFWIGAMFCALLMMPILVVAHRLMGLYNVFIPRPPENVIYLHTNYQPCQCGSRYCNETRLMLGDEHNSTHIILPEGLAEESYVEHENVKPSLTNKRKWD